MKKLTTKDKPTFRETSALAGEHPIVVGVSAAEILLGKKRHSRRAYLRLPVDKVFANAERLLSAENVIETAAEYNGKKLRLVVRPFFVEIGEEGVARSSFYTVPITRIFQIGAELKARADKRERDEEKKAAKDAARKRKA
jgi:hypothetical protein